MTGLAKLIEKRSIRIFAGGIDSVGPGFDRLGFVVSHIKVVKAADKGRFSAAGTSHKDYFAGFYLFGKTEGAVIFLSVFRVNKGSVYGIFFGQTKHLRKQDLQLYFIRFPKSFQ